MRISIEIAPGELLDRISILEVKYEKIKDKQKLYHVENEMKTLSASAFKMYEMLEANKQGEKINSLKSCSQNLKDINNVIWDVLQRQRDLESNARNTEFNLDLKSIPVCDLPLQDLSEDPNASLMILTMVGKHCLYSVGNESRISKQSKQTNEFIGISLAVYHLNDRRAKIKKEINDIMESDIAEVKEYKKYTKYKQRTLPFGEENE